MSYMITNRRIHKLHDYTRRILLAYGDQRKMKKKSGSYLITKGTRILLINNHILTSTAPAGVAFRDYKTGWRYGLDSGFCRFTRTSNSSPFLLCVNGSHALRQALLRMAVIASVAVFARLGLNRVVACDLLNHVSTLRLASSTRLTPIGQVDEVGKE